MSTEMNEQPLTSKRGWDLHPAPRLPDGMQRRVVGPDGIEPEPLPDRVMPLGRSFIPVPLDFRPLPLMLDYLDNLRIDDRSSDYIRMVRVGLIYFSDYLRGEGVLSPNDITRENIIYFQDWLNNIRQPSGKPYARSYKAQLMSYVHHWISWLSDLGHIEKNPWVRIHVAKPKKKPKPLEADEVLSLFEAHRSQAFQLPPFMFHRQEVVLTLLFAWGLRIHELHAIDLMNVDARLDFVTVRNKGGGSKQVPYGAAVKATVQRYLAPRARYSAPDEGALLIDQEGKRLSIDMIRRTIDNLGRKAGVDVTPHRLRDTMGTIMLDNDVEVERIMKMMGHSSRSMTLAYARVNDHKVLESHERVMGPLVESFLASPGAEATAAGERVAERAQAAAQAQALTLQTLGVAETSDFAGGLSEVEREALRRRRTQRRRRAAGH